MARKITETKNQNQNKVEEKVNESKNESKNESTDKPLSGAFDSLKGSLEGYLSKSYVGKPEALEKLPRTFEMIREIMGKLAILASHCEGINVEGEKPPFNVGERVFLPAMGGAKGVVSKVEKADRRGFLVVIRLDGMTIDLPPMSASMAKADKPDA